MITRWENCSKAPGQAKLICLAGAFLTGCAAGVATKSIIECANGREYEGRESGAGGFYVGDSVLSELSRDSGCNDNETDLGGVCVGKDITGEGFGF